MSNWFDHCTWACTLVLSRYNLDPFDEHSDEALWQALDKCHVKDVVIYSRCRT